MSSRAGLAMGCWDNVACFSREANTSAGRPLMATNSPARGKRDRGSQVTGSKLALGSATCLTARHTARHTTRHTAHHTACHTARHPAHHPTCHTARHTARHNTNTVQAHKSTTPHGAAQPKEGAQQPLEHATRQVHGASARHARLTDAVGHLCGQSLLRDHLLAHLRPWTLV